MIVNRLVAAFGAVKEELAARGGLFGAAGHYAQAFCNLVKESPAIKLVLEGFGKAVAVARMNVSGKAPVPQGPHEFVPHCMFGGLVPVG